MTDENFNVLVIYYSQTGRTKDALDLLLGPLRQAPNVQLDEVPILLETPFPYPWSLVQVLSIFPEVVDEQPLPLKKMSLDQSRKYDLIILGCQVWFLSCSLPILSMFRGPHSKVFAGMPVVPLLTYRKAWQQGLQRVESHIDKLSGHLVGKVVIRANDKAPLPILKLMKYERSTDQPEDWHFDRQESQLVSRMGQQLLDALPRLADGKDAVVFQDRSSVFHPLDDRKQTMSTMELMIEKYEQAQKRKYLRWAGFIRRRSSPDTTRRKVWILLCLPLYIPLVYWTAPLLLIRRLFARLG